MEKVYMHGEFSYDDARPGDLVDAAVVMDAMDALPPVTMRLGCAQLGEPYSHREDPLDGKWKPTFDTFRCVEGGFSEGTWEYRGHCFAGEVVERGEEPVWE